MITQNCFIFSSRKNNDDSNSLIVDFPDVPRDESSQVKAKVLSFSPNSQVRFYHFPDDIDNGGKKYQPWHKKSDYATFRNNTRSDIRAYITHLDQACGNELNDTASNRGEMCLYGVEDYLCPNTLIKIRQDRMMHKRAVLQEYSRQVECCDYNPSALRAVSKFHSESARVRAYCYAAGRRSPAKEV